MLCEMEAQPCSGKCTGKAEIEPGISGFDYFPGIPPVIPEPFPKIFSRSRPVREEKFRRPIDWPLETNLSCATSRAVGSMEPNRAALGKP